MGEKTSISWTDHTFNAWWGCVEVSPACDNCYAREWAKRTGFDIWGADKPRRFFADKHWDEPMKWDRAAAAAGVRRTVFTNSMADILENRRDLDEPRERLYALIKATPHLDWLLLSKRWSDLASRTLGPPEWLRNMWLGATVEHRATLGRLRAIRQIEGPAIRFASLEPLLEDLGDLRPFMTFDTSVARTLQPVELWIVGGESGGRARHLSIDAARSVVRQCREMGAIPHVKQLGKWVTGPSDDVCVQRWLLDDGRVFVPPIIGGHARERPAGAVAWGLAHRDGKDISEFPADLQIQEMPQVCA